ncbi:hypothetical protein LCGC14_0520630 [marine sediment metagenome]|uniref:Uncharacterized protein n=1 Tax=marine sediment metagenome TaxID=412755 RepID=A0A0F9RYS4_9ZZZZ
MSKKYLPYTDKERMALLETWEINDGETGQQFIHMGTKVGRYEATVGALEAERDSLRRGADGLIDAGMEFMKERDAALAERDELRRHLKALGNAADAVAAMP